MIDTYLCAWFAVRKYAVSLRKDAKNSYPFEAQDEKNVMTK